jgi:hypothetical protein
MSTLEQKWEMVWRCLLGEISTNRRRSKREHNQATQLDTLTCIESAQKLNKESIKIHARKLGLSFTGWPSLWWLASL